MKYQYIPQIVWHNYFNYFIWNHMCYCFKKWIHQSQYSTDIITHRNMNSTDWMLFKNFILIVKLHSYLFNKWMKWEIVHDEVAQNQKLSSWLFILKFMKKFEYFMYPLCSFIFFSNFLRDFIMIQKCLFFNVILDKNTKENIKYSIDFDHRYQWCTYIKWKI